MHLRHCPSEYMGSRTWSFLLKRKIYIYIYIYIVLMDCDLCVWKKSGVTLNYGRVKYKGLYTESILNLFITSTRKNAINNVITWCYINWNGNGYHSSSQKKKKIRNGYHSFIREQRIQIYFIFFRKERI